MRPRLTAQEIGPSPDTLADAALRAEIERLYAQATEASTEFESPPAEAFSAPTSEHEEYSFSDSDLAAYTSASGG